MKSAFSLAWKSSTKRRKQRKYRYNCPPHIRTSFMAAPLSKPLRVDLKRRSMTVRVGDKVKVLRGSFKNKEAKISAVNRKSEKINLEGIETTKKDGNKIFIAIHPSNVQITALTEDKRRLKREKGNAQPKPRK